MITYPGRVQLNYSIRKNREDQVLEKSILVNIRSQDPDSCLNLFKDIQAKLNGHLEQDDRLLVELENEPEKKRTCPNCESELVLRVGRNGEFWGCSGFRSNGCRYSENA